MTDFTYNNFVQRNNTIKKILDLDNDLNVVIGRYTEKELKKKSDEELFRLFQAMYIWDSQGAV